MANIFEVPKPSNDLLEKADKVRLASIKISQTENQNRIKALNFMADYLEKNSKDDEDSKVITIDQIIFKFNFKKNKNKNFFQNSKNKKIRNDNPQKKQLNKINKLKNYNISKKIDPNSPFAALSSLIEKKG